MLSWQRNPRTDCKSAQQCTTGGTPTIPPSDIRIAAVVWECGEGQTDTQTRVTAIHFASSTTHAKCDETHFKQFNVAVELIQNRQLASCIGL